MEVEDRVKRVKDAYRVEQSEDNEGFSLGNKFIDIICEDRKEHFILEIFWCIHKFGVCRVQDAVAEILSFCICNHSLKCVEALITGQTPLTVDVNAPCTRTGLPPLHYVPMRNPFAYSYITPCMIELLLCNGARTDVRYNKPTVELYQKYAGMLPLQLALRRIAESTCFQEWTHNNSIYKLITICCLGRMQSPLEAITLLAWTTNETEDIFLEYAVQGNVIEFAILLMVAYKRLDNVMHKVTQHFDSIQHAATTPAATTPVDEDDQIKQKVASMRHLVQVFETAGDQISAYLKEDKLYVDKHQSVMEVTCLLVKAGFQFHPLDADLSCFSWFKKDFFGYGKGARGDGYRCLQDLDMAHYSKSGYRWKVSNKDPTYRIFNAKGYLNELKIEAEDLKAANETIIKQQQQPRLQIWRDDELGKALEEDDREKFLCVINSKSSFYRSRQQQLVYFVCASGSVKCAEVLLKGDTCLTVDLNHPCTEMGMYPLHCAALYLFPSMVELFLCSGAQVDIRFRPCDDPSDIYPHSILETHANKLPLHMALWRISRLPCIKEWSPKQSVAKLITLFCLPRMQNALETLSLLSGTTQDIEKEYIEHAMGGKVVEFAALLMVFDHRFYDVSKRVYKLCSYFEDFHNLDNDQKQEIKSVHQLRELFQWSPGSSIKQYVKEDKYNVSKYQTMEDVACLLQTDESDTDLSVYKWYRDEEPCYPSKAPYESVRLRHDDVGMEHYFVSGFRWIRSEKELRTWRYAKVETQMKEMENRIHNLKKEHVKQKRRLEEALKPASFEIPDILYEGVSSMASSCLFSSNNLKLKEHQIWKNTLSQNLRGFPSRKMMISTLALHFKRIVKRECIQ